MKKLCLVGMLILILLSLASCSEPCADGHTAALRVEDATCSSEGVRIEYCKVCDEILSRVTLEKIPHTPEAEGTVIRKSSCTEEGIVERRCTVCGEVAMNEPLEKLSHTPGEWTTVQEATCTEEGIREKACTVCGEVTESEHFLAEHVAEELLAADPTCTAEGLTVGSKCSVCEEILVPQTTIAPLSHSFVKVFPVAPTCNSYGYTAGSKCERCGEWETVPDRIDMLPHTLVTDEAKEATCTEDGLTEGSHCSVCRSTVVAQQKISAKGHDFNVFANECRVCNVKQYDEIVSKNVFDEYDGSYNAVIYLDKCLFVEETDQHSTVTVKAEADHIRLVGTAGIEYNLSIVIDAARETEVLIELVNVSLVTTEKSPIIQCDATVRVSLGLYGTCCSLSGKDGKNGENGYLLSTKGGVGEDGLEAISIKGDLVIRVSANEAMINGGDGGNGGKGMDAIFYSPMDGSNGGKGGQGAYAIVASSVTVKGINGFSYANLILSGGDGGVGGKGGSGGIWPGKDGKSGADGESRSATSVEVTY